jgi:hypothetical protein
VTTSPASLVKTELLKRLVDVGEVSYRENARIASVLDDKAQRTSTISGVFLAAGFAALKPETLATLSGPVMLTLLSMVVALLMVSVGASLVAMWVRRNPPPLSIADISSIARDVLALPEDRITPEVETRVYLDQGRIWSVCVADQDKVNAAKAQLLKFAQVSLALAILTAGTFLAVLLKRALG